jgi:hypothetical protein
VYLFAKNFREDAPWQGSSTDLYNTLNERLSDEYGRLPKDFPARPKELSGIMGRIAPALKSVGAVWERASKSNKQGKKYRLYYETPEGDATSEEGDATDSDSVPPENAPDTPNTAGGTQGDAGDATFPTPEDNEYKGEIL